jgi:hypothetical protein
MIRQGAISGRHEPALSATVLCMKWGRRYGPEYVNRLFAMVARHLALPHRFVCLTDDADGIRGEVECRPLPAIELADAAEHSGWRKLSCFSAELDDLEGRILFLDLDLIVVADIDCLFNHPGTFCIIENWTQPARGIGNSSVFRFEAGAHRPVLERFCADAARIIRNYPNEQTYLTQSVGEATFWPAGWCRCRGCWNIGGEQVFSWRCQLPTTGSVAIFPAQLEWLGGLV